MHLAKRLLLCTFAFVAGSIGLYWLLGKAAVYYEMYATNASTRAELADDYGLGLIGLFVVLPLSLLLALGSSVIMWFRLRRNARGQDA